MREFMAMSMLEDSLLRSLEKLVNLMEQPTEQKQLVENVVGQGQSKDNTKTKKAQEVGQEHDGAFASFLLFPKLAPKLRLMVWKCAMPKHWVIIMDYRECTDDSQDSQRRREVCQANKPAASSSGPSDYAVSHANHEARQLASKTRCFSFLAILHRPVCCNISEDAVYFRDERAAGQVLWHVSQTKFAGSRERDDQKMSDVMFERTWDQTSYA